MSSTHLIAQSVQGRNLLQDVSVVIGSSIIIALFAPIAIHLPFTPVPIATQPHVILLLAALLGSKRGSLAVLAFLLQGMAGFPVFSGGTFGVLAFVGPRAGYLVGYLVAAWITGYLAEQMRERTVTKAFGAMTVGNLAIYLTGLPWLAQFIGWKYAFLLGMLPFLLGDLLKLCVGVRALKALRFFRV
ncbi:MAG: biotin transporter BioY [Verrucomicrobia bacterium]|nr:biotin transporter BioY [Verrucomicrobiota bacterium]